MESKKRLRVLLDTDVGDDIDDALAIVFALNSPGIGDCVCYDRVSQC